MKRIVIVGGGFAGSFIARQLESDFDVTLIDSKNYFEFTPGVLRSIVQPEHLRKTEVLHREYLKKARLIVGHVTKVSEKYVFLKSKRVHFDYLIITTGSRYNTPFKEQDIVIASRARNLQSKWKDLCKAKTVLIVGGGLVGVELAAEILGKYKDKKIILAHSKETLIERNHPRSIQYAETFLKSKGVKIMYKERVIKKHGGYYITTKGTKIKADIAFLCTGIIPNYEFLKAHFSNSLNEKGYVRVNSHLQVEGYTKIFAAGDVTDRFEEKTAQNAQRQAAIVVKNIRRIESGKDLKNYYSKKTPLVISLGAYNGIFEHKTTVFTGLIPAFFKWIVEKKEIFRRKFISF